MSRIHYLKASPMCRTQRFTNDPAAVTCRRCRRRMLRDGQIPGPIRSRDGVPVFAVRRVRQSICFVCPKCGQENHHGGGRYFGDGDGHRCEHCPCWPQGYYLEEQAPPTTVLRNTTKQAQP